MRDINGQSKVDRDLATCKYIIEEQNQAALIVIDGFVGSGKTSIAVNMAERYQGGPLDYSCQYANGAEEFITKIVECKKKNKGVIVFDEASDFGSRSAMTGLNRRVNEVFNQYRAFRILVIICLPSISFIDRQIFRKGVLRMLYHIRRKKQGKYAEAVCYSATQTEWILYKMGRFKANLELAYSSQRRCYIVRFPPLTKAKDDKLTEITIGKKIERIQSLTKYANRKELAQQIGRSEWWINKKIKELNLKPAMKKGKREFYDKSVIKDLEAA